MAGISAGFLWGAWMPITKYGITHSLNVSDVIFLRFLTAMIIAIPFLIKFGFTAKGGSFYKTLVLVLSSGIGYVAISSVGFKYSPASYGGIIPVCMIFFSTLISATLYKQKISTQKWLALVIISIGFVVFSMGINTRSSEFLGIIFFVVAGLFFAIYNVSAKHWQISPLHGVALVSFYSFVLFLPWYLYAEKNIYTASFNEILLQIIYQGLLVSFVALVCFSYCAQKLGAAKAALFAILMPVTGVLFSVIFLQEELSTLVFLALVFMVLGMLVGIIPAKRKEQDTC